MNKESIDDVWRRVRERDALAVSGKVRLSDVLDEVGREWREARGCPPQEHVADYADGELAFGPRVRVWLHLRRCRVCRLEAAAFRAILRRAEAETAEAAPGAPAAPAARRRPGAGLMPDFGPDFALVRTRGTARRALTGAALTGDALGGGAGTSESLRGPAPLGQRRRGAAGRFADWYEARIPRFPLRYALMAVYLLTMSGAFGVTGVALRRYNALTKQLGFAEPFSVRLSATGRSRVQLDVTVHRDAVREVYVDWGDPSAPAPAGGERVYPSQGGLDVGDERVMLAPVTHEYAGLPGDGLRTSIRVRVVPATLPDVRPETLSDAALDSSRDIWVLPWGVILDPPAATLAFVAPEAGAVAGAVTELRLRAAALTADVHVLATDPENPAVLHYLGRRPAPVPGQEDTLMLTVDLRRFEASPAVRLLAVSTHQIDGTTGDTVPASAVPPSAPSAAIDLRNAVVITEPRPGDVVAGTGTVRGRVLLPGQHYAAVLIRPSREGVYWVQNDGFDVRAPAEFRIDVAYGGADTYEVYVGVTQDAALFRRGARLAQRPMVDGLGRPVHWVGPINTRQR